MDYAKTTLVQRQPNKPYYVQTTIPEELRPLYKGQKQKRVSTRTADRRKAEMLKHEISSQIYKEFDEKRREPTRQEYQRTLEKVYAFAILARPLGVVSKFFTVNGDRWITPENKLYNEFTWKQRKRAEMRNNSRIINFDGLKINTRNSIPEFIKFRRSLEILGYTVYGYKKPSPSNTFLEFSGDFAKYVFGYGDDYMRDPLVTSLWNKVFTDLYNEKNIPITEDDKREWHSIRPLLQLREEDYRYRRDYRKIDKLGRYAIIPEYSKKADPFNEEIEQADHTSVRMSDLIDSYINSKVWNRLKTKNTAIRHLNQVSEILNNPSLTSISQRDAINTAKALIEDSKQKGKPIKYATLNTHMSNVSVFLRYCVREGYCDSNAFLDLDLKGLGADETVNSYVPFTKLELHKLFDLTMPEQDKLLLSILTTTGMRLDEAALLTWDQVQEEDGIRFLSLHDSADQKVIVKTQGSKRNVPLPDVLALPQKGTGRLFDYKLDADGKAQKEASKKLMKHVRKVTSMRTKTVHSLRGTFKDLLRDADITKELNDFITGHAAGDVAGKYGSGFSLSKRYEAINSIDHPWLI